MLGHIVNLDVTSLQEMIVASIRRIFVWIVYIGFEIAAEEFDDDTATEIRRTRLDVQLIGSSMIFPYDAVLGDVVLQVIAKVIQNGRDVETDIICFRSEFQRRGKRSILGKEKANGWYIRETLA